MSRKISIEELKFQYESNLEIYEKFRSSLIEQLNTIIVNNKIQLGVPIQSRLKKWESIQEKIDSGRFTPKKSIFELQDIVGLRAILLFQRDVNSFNELIHSNFFINRSYNSIRNLQDNQFGYLSIHTIISIPENWSNVPTFHGMKGFIAELQIRTLSQHSWAETSQFFQYKKENNVPKSLIRSVNRISALLETIDLEYERLLIERKTYISEIEESSKIINEERLLNVDILEAILDEYSPKHKTKGEKYSESLDILNFFGILKVKDLMELIKIELPTVLENEKQLVKNLIKMYAVGEKIEEQSLYKVNTLKGVQDIDIDLIFIYNHFMIVENMLKYRDNRMHEQYIKKNSF